MEVQVALADHHAFTAGAGTPSRKDLHWQGLDRWVWDPQVPAAWNISGFATCSSPHTYQEVSGQLWYDYVVQNLHVGSHLPEECGPTSMVWYWCQALWNSASLSTCYILVKSTNDLVVILVNELSLNVVLYMNKYNHACCHMCKFHSCCMSLIKSYGWTLVQVDVIWWTCLMISVILLWKDLQKWKFYKWFFLV